jgi:hypothetical protein
MAGKYRALLIGNSTYPADDHNLQSLKGPVKDIAALNRALVDRDTGLFADGDVTLLAEASSTRALRAMSQFFSSADRDDVLLVYFSGHGKLDQSGRLHLCMHDTESTDLLSTAVSSTRINEFADASRARNVVIILDCCHAGAFRGGDFGEAVAGPGRYVLSSCRGTQLANDATVDNGTSYFTQHLVEGLVDAAVDNDSDGFVGFSDVYNYVDRKLREDGKQIPQRRVDGDGDLRLAKRLRPSSMAAMDEPLPPTAATQPVPARPPSAGPPSAGPPSKRRRRFVLAGAAATLVAVGVVVAIVVSSNNGGGAGAPTGASQSRSGVYNASGPWRMLLQDVSQGTDPGCALSITDPQSGATISLVDGVYSKATLQIRQSGAIHWQVSSSSCAATPAAGSGDLSLPATVEASRGQTDAFTAPDLVSIQVVDFSGDSSCTIRLYDPSNAQLLDSGLTAPGNDTVKLDPRGAKTAYVYPDDCGVRISSAR